MGGNIKTQQTLSSRITAAGKKTETFQDELEETFRKQQKVGKHLNIIQQHRRELWNELERDHTRITRVSEEQKGEFD